MTGSAPGSASCAQSAPARRGSPAPPGWSAGPGSCPAQPGDLLDPLDPVGDRIGVDVQAARRPLRAAVLPEVAGERGQVLGPPFALAPRTELPSTSAANDRSSARSGTCSSSRWMPRSSNAATAPARPEPPQRLDRPVRLARRSGRSPAGRGTARRSRGDHLGVGEQLGQPGHAGLGRGAARQAAPCPSRARQPPAPPRASRTEMIASGARVVTKCSITSRTRCRQRLAVRAAARPRGVEGDGQHVVLARRVVAEVRRPTVRRRRRRGRAPSSSPSTRSSRTRRAAAATTRSRPSITPQIVAACSVTSRFMSSSPTALRQVEGDQVGGHLVADQDRRDDDGGHPADPGQPQRAVALPRRPQDLAEARVDQRVGAP